MLFTKQDLFTAHEIVQLLPVFERDAIYEKFIHTNQWLRKFLPNFQIKIKPVFRKRQNYFGRAFIFLCQGIFLEKILKKLQLVYMEKAITKERLEDGFIGLHPFDYKSYILKKYKQKLGKSGLKDDTTRGH
jgi:hypothetical protein